MTMTTVEHREMLGFADTLRSALAAATTLRSERQAATTGRYGAEMVWMARERELLHRMVNGRRAEMMIPGATEDEVYAVEQSAAGHSDYAHKFTLRLAMLTYGQEWKP